MIRKWVSSPRMFFPTLFTSSFSFSRPKQSSAKVQTVGFVSNNIENLKYFDGKQKFELQISQPVRYENGRCLIFKSHLSIWRVLRDYFIEATTTTLLAYCLINQISFNVYPIIKHIYVAGLAICGVLMARRFLRNHNVVREIYLLEGGKATRIVYQNQWKRKLFGEPLEETFYNSLFVQPDETQGSHSKMYCFPETTEQVESPVIFLYWKKHCSNKGNLLLIPTQFDFMQPQLMVNILKGKIIQS